MENPQLNNACIIGAGPSGLAAARVLKTYGIVFDQYERHSDVGGIWDIENPGSAMYESAHFISSKYLSGYTNYPMPEDYPDYPNHHQILSYIKSFARDFGLYETIQFNTSVKSVVKNGEQWHVTLNTGEHKLYRHLICANGHTWTPNLPHYPGVFAGELIHSKAYRTKESFKGKRVLIIGGGNSAVDIACDAAIEADAAFISMRRGYHIVPKYLFGKPTDVFFHSGPQAPMWISQPVLKLLISLSLGKQSKYGLKEPDHKILESHPLVGTQLLHHLGHGDIKAMDDVDFFQDKTVAFKDGQSVEVDLIVCATGYEYDIPYMDKNEFDWNGYKPKLNFGLLSPKHSNLYCIGFIELNSGGYHIYEQMANIIANTILDSVHNPEKIEELAKIKARPIDFSGGLKFVDSDRHADYMDFNSLQKEFKKLHKKMGWSSNFT